MATQASMFDAAPPPPSRRERGARLVAPAQGPVRVEFELDQDEWQTVRLVMVRRNQTVAEVCEGAMRAALVALRREVCG